MKAWLDSTLVIGTWILPFSPRELIFSFLIPVLAILASAGLVGFILRRVLQRSVKDDSRRQNALKWMRRILRLLVILGIALSLGSLLGAKAWEAFGNFFRILNTPFFSSGRTSLSVVSLILIIPVFAFANWTGKIVGRGLKSGALTRFGLDDEQSFTIGRLLRYGVMSLVFLFGLSVVGIDLSAIGVLFGVLGIGIGFGLQGLVADFFAGVTLIGMGLVKEGDRIQIDGQHDGVIRHIRLINTELITFENETLIIPNSRLTGGPIHNYSYKDRRVVIVNQVDVSYNTDLDLAVGVLEDVARRNPWLQESSEINVRVQAFADSGITLQLRTWIRDVAEKADAYSWTNLEIWRTFARQKIEIPFPQRVVHQAPLITDKVEGLATSEADPGSEITSDHTDINIDSDSSDSDE